MRAGKSKAAPEFSNLFIQYETENTFEHSVTISHRKKYILYLTEHWAKVGGLDVSTLLSLSFSLPFSPPRHPRWEDFWGKWTALL